MCETVKVLRRVEGALSWDMRQRLYAVKQLQNDIRQQQLISHHELNCQYYGNIMYWDDRNAWTINIQIKYKQKRSDHPQKVVNFNVKWFEGIYSILNIKEFTQTENRQTMITYIVNTLPKQQQT
jgi:hypothetical protein